MADDNTGDDTTLQGGGDDPGVPERPPELPEKFWNPETGEIRVPELTRSYVELEKWRSQGVDALKPVVEEELKAKLREGAPETPDAYELPTREELKLPEGLDFDPNNPTVGKFRELAHKYGVSKEDFKAIMADYAAEVVGSYDPQAELAKLGDTAQARISAVQSVLKAKLGDEGLEALKPAIVDAQSFTALEKLLSETGTLKPAEGGGAPGTAGGETLADIEKLMNDPRYYDPVKRDISYIEDVQARLRKLQPGKVRLG